MIDGNSIEWMEIGIGDDEESPQSVEKASIFDIISIEKMEEIMPKQSAIFMYE